MFPAGSRSRRPFIAIAALLGLLPVLPILLKGSPVLNNDMLFGYFCYFWDFHANWSWRHPLVFWDSSYQTGMPMHAYWQSGYLYPVTWLLFGPLSPHVGIHLFYAFHFALAIAGFLALGPRLGLHRPAALWAGIAFSLSGTMLGRYEHATFFAGWSWLPPVLSAFLALRDAPSPASLLRYGACVALQALGGHPQASATAAILIGLFTLPSATGCILLPAAACLPAGVASRIRYPRRIPSVGAPPSPGRRAGWVLLGHALALVLCLPLVMPFVDLVGRTNRYDGAAWEGKAAEKSAGAALAEGAFRFEKFSTGGMRPLHFLSLGAAHALGTPSDASWWGGEAWGDMFLYLGVLGICFCAFASWGRAGPDMRLLWVAGLVGLWLAFGAHLGASQILYRVPVFNNLRFPGRYLVLAALGFAALSAHGFQRWLGRPRHGGRLPAVLIVAGLAGAAAFLALRLVPEAGTALLEAVREVKRLDPAKDYAEKIADLASRLSQDGVVTALAGLALWLAAAFTRRMPKRRWFGIPARPALLILFAVQCLDLLRLHWDHFYPFPASYYRVQPATAPLMDAPSRPFWRIASYLEYPGTELWRMHNDPLASWPLFEREKDALGYGVHAVFGYRHVSALLPLLWRWEPGTPPSAKGARYLLSNLDMAAFGGDSLRSLGREGEVRVYEVAGWRPRFERRPGPAAAEGPAGPGAEAESAQSDAAAATRLADTRPANAGPPIAGVCEAGEAGWDGLCVKEIRDGRIRIRGAFAPGDTLRVRERAYPGWRYRLGEGPWRDAPESPDHFLALPLDAPADVVDLAYTPVDLLFWAAVAGPAALILFGFAYRLRNLT